MKWKSEKPTSHSNNCILRSKRYRNLEINHYCQIIWIIVKKKATFYLFSFFIYFSSWRPQFRLSFIFLDHFLLTAEYPTAWVNIFLDISRSLTICAQVESRIIMAGYSAAVLWRRIHWGGTWYRAKVKTRITFPRWFLIKAGKQTRVFKSPLFFCIRGNPSNLQSIEHSSTLSKENMNRLVNLSY